MADVEPLVRDEVFLDLFHKLQLILLHCDKLVGPVFFPLRLELSLGGWVGGWGKASRETRFISRCSMDEALAKSLPILAFNYFKINSAVKGCLKHIKVIKQPNWCQRA